MDLSEDLKKEIDAWSIRTLLEKVRYTPVGDPLFQGNTGTYILRRLVELRRAPGGSKEYVAASKMLDRR